MSFRFFAYKNCLEKCFGIGWEDENLETAAFNSTHDYEYCCYHRCDENWRCSRKDCSFDIRLKPEYHETLAVKQGGWKQ